MLESYINKSLMLHMMLKIREAEMNVKNSML